MNLSPLILFALVAGALIPVQAGMNAIVGIRTGNPIWATTLNFIVGTVALIAIVGLRGQLGAFRAAVVTLPPWLFAGGLLGAVFVTASLFLAPRLGATNMLAAIIAGQLVTALLLDHFGVLGYPVHEISLSRVLGVLLLAVAVILIKR